jgi:hypothetical protein
MYLLPPAKGLLASFQNTLGNLARFLAIEIVGLARGGVERAFAEVRVALRCRDRAVAEREVRAP